MPRRAKGTRLWLRPEERDEGGALRLRAVWVIRDGPRKISTGCAPQDRAGAERRLGEYLADRHEPSRTRGRHPSEILIADVLAIYLTDVAPRHSREEETKQRVLTLDAWWADRTLADVSGATCRAYVAHRTSQARRSSKPETTGRPARIVTAAAARRELEDLRAAINHHRREGLCSEVVSVVLPPRGLSREKWLTRTEAARLLWAAWRAKQVMFGKATRRAVGQHIARFILIGLYTGTRSSAICGAALISTIGRGHVDLDRGVFYRRAIGRGETKKRQPPVRLPLRLLLGPEVTPHTLRRTAATWLMQAGVDLWQAAGFLGMTVEQLERTYGHHHPDYQEQAVAALGGQYAERNSVNKRR